MMCSSAAAAIEVEAEAIFATRSCVERERDWFNNVSSSSPPLPPFLPLSVFFDGGGDHDDGRQGEFGVL